MTKPSQLTDDLPPIQNRITLYREEAGLSLRVFAQRIGISRQHLYRVESGQAMPSLATALRISRFFEVPLEDVFICGWGEKVFHSARERQLEELEKENALAREKLIEMGIISDTSEIDEDPFAFPPDL